MSSIFKGLHEGFDFAAFQEEGKKRIAAINANPELYSKKYDIPLDHKHFVGAVLTAMDREEQREKQIKRDAEYKARTEKTRADRLAQDKQNIDQLKAELAQLQKGFDPNYEYSDDYTFWSNQKDISNKINNLKKRISDVESVSENKEAEYGPEWDEKVKRVGQLAKEGPRKTVWDPVKQVYKTVPVKQSAIGQGVAEESEVSQLHKAWDKALDTKPVSPQQQQRNKERWAKRQAERNKEVDEGYDKWGWHTSVVNGEFMPTKYGNKNYVYLHDLDNESPRGGPQLVTVNKPTVAQRIARQFGAKVVKTDLNTYRIVKPAEQGVAEGVATSLPMSDAVKLLRQYGADNFKTTTNELHFYKDGRPFSVDLIMNPDTTRSVTLSSLNSATRGLKGQGIAEGSLEEYGDTSKGQKMLAKVHHRAADKVTSKKADTDPQYARKAQQTQDRAHDRLKGVAEGLDAEAYKEKLLATLPQMMRFYEKNVKGWKPSEEQMLAAVETGYTVMKHTGDVKQAGKAVMDELNTLHRMSQGQQGVAEAGDVSHLHKALDRALSKEKKASPAQVQRNKERWAQRQAEKEQGNKDMKIDELTINEDWQKVNKKDKTDGMSRKAVKAYRRENPGSKLKTAVTTKPSKLKKGSKAAKRRKSFCARMSGMKKAHASAKTKRDPDSPINKALRRWNCESIEQMQELIMIAESKIAEAKNAKQQAAIAIAKKAAKKG